MAPPFVYERGRLSASGVALADLAAELGTPLYVYDRAAIAARVAAVREAFAGHPTRLCYSVKANSNLRLLGWLAGQGLGFDVVSGGELARVEAAGVSAEEVVFAGVGKTPEELALATRAGLWMINAESVEELELLADAAEAVGAAGAGGAERVRVSLRLNPDVDARTHRHITTGRGVDKFGIAMEEYDDALEVLTRRHALELVGLHMHIGSQITDPEPYGAAVRVVADAVRRARDRGHAVRWLNAGGGFGIAYGDAPVPAPADFAAAIVPAVAELGVELVLELGRYLVGPAGCLLTRVLYRKERGGRALVIVDAGMTDLLRPALYDAHHRIVPLEEPDPGAARTTDVAGPICESSDFLGRDRALPPLERGALLAVLDAGAYGMAMASHYNSHPRPAEAWITEDGDIEVIRRRETVDDVLAVERESLDA
jgi:diaminopimelate decarboxylase